MVNLLHAEALIRNEGTFHMELAAAGCSVCNRTGPVGTTCSMSTRLSSTTIRSTTSCSTFCCTVKEGVSMAPPDTKAKGINTFQKPQLCAPLSPLLVNFPHPFSQHTPVIFNSSAALRPNKLGSI
jgi:hypothetical protein